MIATPRLVLLVLLTTPLAVLPLAVERAWPLCAAAWGVIAVAVAVDLALVRATRLAGRIVRPAHLGVGSVAPLGLELELDAPVRVRLDARLVATPPLEAPPAQRFDVASGRHRLPLPALAMRRGTARVERVWLRVRSALGLVARIEATDEGAGDVAVVPDAERVDKATMEVLGVQAMLGALKRERWAGEGGELESLQAYSPGMDVGAIDWKASARHLSLRVRRFHVERRQRIVCTLDLGRAMADPIEGLERLDHAIHTALVLSKVALRAGDLVGMHAYAGAPASWEPPRGGAAQYARLRAAAAAMRSASEETNHVLGLHDLLRRVSRRSMILVFTDFTDATTAELTIEVLGQLARRHVVVFVALDDPLLERPYVDAPESSGALARALVAADVQARRHHVLARLARLGVHVVASPPGAVAARVVERYVKLKKRGLLG